MSILKPLKNDEESNILIGKMKIFDNESSEENIENQDLSIEQGLHTFSLKKNVIKSERLIYKQDLLLDKLKDISLEEATVEDENISISESEKEYLQAYDNEESAATPADLTAALSQEIEDEPPYSENIPQDDPFPALSSEKKSSPSLDYEKELSVQKENVRKEIEDYKAKAMRKAEEEAKTLAGDAVKKEIATYKAEQMAKIDSEKKAILDKAFEEGIEKGSKKAIEDLQKKGSELIDAIKELTQEKGELINKFEPEILSLSIKIAETIVQCELKQSPEAINNVINEAIRRITDKDRVIIKVNTEDAGAVRKHRDYLHQLMSDIKSLEVEEDQRIEKGGCIIETNLGFIDSSISTKLETIKLALLSTYEEIIEEQKKAIPKAKDENQPAEKLAAITEQKEKLDHDDDLADEDSEDVEAAIDII
jgi:flagellar assembly protein FliH